MPDILNIATSGLRAYQGALSTTSHNISNVGNENYTRQRVEFDARNPIRLGSDFFGQGVDLSSVDRIIDEFNSVNMRDLLSNTERLSTFESFASRVETIVADDQANLMPALDGFFNALNDVANDPSASAPRVALLGAAELLEQRFISMGSELQKLESEVNANIRADISEINSITTELARINATLTSVSSVDNYPSDLLDQRDGLLKQLSEKITVTVVEQENGNINVLAGTGQLLVTNATALQLTTQTDAAQPSRTSVSVQAFGGSVTITDSLVGGDLGGLLDFRDNMLNTAQNRLGRTAIGLAEAINAQHIQGYDLNGDLGTNLFSTVSTGHLQAQFGGDYINNGFDNVAGETVSFDLNFDNVTLSPVNVVVAPGDTNDVIGQSILDAIGVASGVAANPDGSYTIPGTTPGVSITFDLYGSNIQFETAGGPSPYGNNLTITNLADTAGGDASMGLSSLGSSSTRLSAGVVSIGSPATFIGPSTVAIPNQNNAGTAVVNYSITDVSALTVSDYEVFYDGTNYQVTRLSDNQVFAAGPGPFFIDGLEITAGGAGTPAVNDSFFISPTEAGAVRFKNLANNPDKIATASPVRAIGNVNNLGAVDVSPVTITDVTDGDLTRSVDIFFDPANPAGSFDVVDQATGAVLQNDVIYFDGININQNGWQVQLTGTTPPAGDRFSIQENVNATADNRNALLLAKFQSLGVLDAGNTSFEQSYSTLVSEVGVVTQQVQINLEVEESLLNSAIERRESISGVNLDEEAADLIRFQQAYQAMSRVVQTSQELFDSLLAAV